MKALNVIDQTIVERSRHYAQELMSLSGPRAYLGTNGCPDELRLKVRNSARNLLKALEALEAEQNPIERSNP